MVLIRAGTSADLKVAMTAVLMVALWVVPRVWKLVLNQVEKLAVSMVEWRVDEKGMTKVERLVDKLD